MSAISSTASDHDQRHQGSLAVCQRSHGDRAITYPLWPPLTEGCPQTSTDVVQYPIDVEYDLGAVDRALFDAPLVAGLGRWAPLLPPLAPGVELGEGNSPLIPVPRLAAYAGFDGDLYLKDESCNPTWSHKDRQNVCAVSAAMLSGAPGVVVASSGNHGASAAAYAGRLGLPCIIITNQGAPRAVQSYLSAYGAAVVAVPGPERWPLMREVVRRLGYHPVSNLTPCHTGHPFAPEGNKTIAYEIFLQLGRRVPAAVFVPSGYSELLFGIWKGFAELRELGLANAVPRMMACEPAVRGPLLKALTEGSPVGHVEFHPTIAYSVATTVSGYRGILAVKGSDGSAVAVSEEAIREAGTVQAHNGFWHELSGAIALAGLRTVAAGGTSFDGPVVVVSTSCGFKDKGVGDEEVTEITSDWPTVSRELSKAGIKA